MLKEFFNADVFMLKVAKYLSKLPISPNMWTAISVVPALIGVWFAVTQNLIAAFVLFFISGAVDAVDGAVARYRGTSTRLGAFLDGVIDRMIDFLIVFSFLFVGFPDFFIPLSWWVAIAAYWALMPTFIVAYANHRHAVDDPSEKIVWRILHRVEMYGLWLISLIIGAFNVTFGMYIFVFTAVLSVITSFQAFFLAIYKSKYEGKKF